MMRRSDGSPGPRLHVSANRETRTPWPAQLLALSAIWGLSFLFIKVADEARAPVQ